MYLNFLLVLCLIVTCNLIAVNANHGIDFDDEEHDVTTTAKPESNEVTDLPDTVIQNALYENIGAYSTIKFEYANNFWQGEMNRPREYCYNQYIKCSVSLAVPIAICGYDLKNYMETFDNYCDLYFKNCLDGFRKWRVLAYGRCVHWDSAQDIIHKRSMGHNEDYFNRRYIEVPNENK